MQKSVDESENRAYELTGAVAELQKLLREAAQGRQMFETVHSTINKQTIFTYWSKKRKLRTLSLSEQMITTHFKAQSHVVPTWD